MMFSKQLEINKKFNFSKYNKFDSFVVQSDRIKNWDVYSINILVTSIIFLSRSKTLTMIPSEKIQLFNTQKQSSKNNPEQAATRLLLQISDEDYSYDPLNVTDHLKQPKLNKHRSNYSQKSSKFFKRESISKVQIPCYLYRTQNNFHKESPRYFAGEEVCVMKKEKVVNLSNFLLIDNQSNPGILNTIPKQQLKEENKGSPKPKPPRNIVAFIRRRNLSYLKQQLSNQLEQKKSPNIQKKINNRNFSPLKRINASCQLKKTDQQIVEAKSTNIFQRPFNASPEMNCTSPSFRNSNMSNYIKQRLNVVKGLKFLYF